MCYACRISLIPSYNLRPVCCWNSLLLLVEFLFCYDNPGFYFKFASCIIYYQATKYLKYSRLSSCFLTTIMYIAFGCLEIIICYIKYYIGTNIKFLAGAKLFAFKTQSRSRMGPACPLSVLYLTCQHWMLACRRRCRRKHVGYLWTYWMKSLTFWLWGY
jgi:hypothetical protein